MCVAIVVGAFMRFDVPKEIIKKKLYTQKDPARYINAFPNYRMPETDQTPYAGQLNFKVSETKAP